MQKFTHGLTAGKTSNFYLPNNPFICFKSDTTIFNQIKGNEMSGTFFQNILQKISVLSQGESIYLVKEYNKNIDLNNTKYHKL